MIVNLKDKLLRTRSILKDRIDDLLTSKKSREEILDGLAELLILADVGINSTENIVESIRQNSSKTGAFTDFKDILEREIIQILSRYPLEVHLQAPKSVFMFVGVNGGGKTTSMAKVAYHYQADGKKIMMVAADTFRAAAQEQLSIWGKRLNIPVVKGPYGADPASVTYDALQSFLAKDYQLLLVDTAGRIHTNTNLMNEVEKIKRIISREIQGAPQEILLVLDASIGQNALHQAQEFLKFSGLTGVFLSKLDGTAKGGSVIGIVDELKLPVKFIGTGEGEQDMARFSPQDFTCALLS
jgi:fused signal recognition particle receptor